MDESKTFRFDDSGLRGLLKVMSSEHVVRVGIFGGQHFEADTKKTFSDQGRLGARKKTKTPSGMSNAEVGFLMEFGRPKIGAEARIPARSWLRMPIFTKINQIVQDSARGFTQAVKDGDAMRFLTIIGLNAEKWIGLAFDTRGFGSWAANAPATIEAKGSDAPLIDTGQLRRAVASVVI